MVTELVEYTYKEKVAQRRALAGTKAIAELSGSTTAYRYSEH